MVLNPDGANFLKLTDEAADADALPNYLQHQRRSVDRRWLVSQPRVKQIGTTHNVRLLGALPSR
jgi:hypothetical protein